MYLLIHPTQTKGNVGNMYLHPTMYLLILTVAPNESSLSAFTSHYVSINSNSVAAILRKMELYLHPTMYLLILFCLKN